MVSTMRVAVYSTQNNSFKLVWENPVVILKLARGWHAGIMLGQYLGSQAGSKSNETQKHGQATYKAFKFVPDLWPSTGRSKAAPLN